MEAGVGFMRKVILVSDFTIREIPFGGSEWVDQVILKKFPVEFQYSHLVNSFDSANMYIISNISRLPSHLLPQLMMCDYIMIEHDSKFCQNRHPWAYPNSIVPQKDRINYDLYEKAKAVFVQTTDHLEVFKINDVKANFYNLDGGIWSDDDLSLFESLYRENKNGKAMIYSTENWIKNTRGTIQFCAANNIDFDLVSDAKTRLEFLSTMSQYSKLVFIPLARETLCRLVVEARCLGLQVLTTQNYGASKSEWFKYSRDDLLKYLKQNTQKNLCKIEEYL